MSRTFQFLLLAILTLTATAQDRRIAPASGSARRMALVIGNNAYPWKPLVNSVNDARALAALLPKVGFYPDDITLLTDANLKQMQRAGREFIERLRAGDLALVFYSGHGVEVRGENFLIPVDFPSDASELEARDDAYSAQQLLRGLEESAAVTRILILDACRNNSLRATRSTGGGLALMDGKGTLIVYSTSAGQTADDNPRGVNGLFTTELLKALPTPGVSMGQIMQDVARSVYRNSGSKQTPAMYGLLLEDFPLVPGTLHASNNCAEAWTLVKDTNDNGILEQFVTDFSNCDEAKLARLRLRRPAAAPIAATIAPPISDQGVKGGATRINPRDGQKYVWVPAGSFTMGCSRGDSECSENEKPAHEVTITSGFWLGQTPVTQQAYERVTGRNPSILKSASRPVETVSWYDAQSYCRAIGGRLPTEAEWEYAARAGATGPRYGNLYQTAWHYDNSGGTTHEVGLKHPNSFGLYDMLGNVWQWVEDSYGAYFSEAQTDPPGPESGESKAVRGGSWFSYPRLVRLSSRSGGGPSNRVDTFGFRCIGE